MWRSLRSLRDELLPDVGTVRRVTSVLPRASWHYRFVIRTSGSGKWPPLVDKDAKKITIRHGAIANLEMPPMTMVFQVSDPAVLDRIKAGDKIRFAAEKREGAFTVTRIETAG